MTTNHGLSEKTIALITGVLGRFPSVEKAVLYGSRAKGNFKPGSDIDLTLFGDDLDLRTMGQIDEALDDLLLPVRFDLSVFSEITNGELLDHIQRVGVVLYAKAPAPAWQG